MDKPEQLTFSDDPILNGLNIACADIREGDFSEAVNRLNQLMDDNPDYPGLAAGYRTAKFWLNRSEEIASIPRGKKTADFLMEEWANYEEYAAGKNMLNGSAYKAAMMYIYYTAAEHYRLAFMTQEDTAGNFSLLLNLGSCFLKLGDYHKTVETLEYAARSYNPNAKLLSILAEAYYRIGEKHKGLWYFREAFFINPSDIDLDIITAEPIVDLIEHIRQVRPDCPDVREWIPVYGFITDTLYVRRNLQDRRQIQSIKDQCYNLEVSFQRLNKEQLNTGNVLPRLLTRYLWLLDYFEFQEYSYNDIGQIKERLLQIDRPLFEEYLRRTRR